MGWAGALMMVCGFALGLLGLFLPGAPGYSDNLNLGLLNGKTNYTVAGAALFVGGAVLAAAGEILGEIRERFKRPDA